MNHILATGMSGVGTLEAHLDAGSDHRSHDPWQPTP